MCFSLSPPLCLHPSIPPSLPAFLASFLSLSLALSVCVSDSHDACTAGEIWKCQICPFMQAEVCGSLNADIIIERASQQSKTRTFARVHFCCNPGSAVSQRRARPLGLAAMASVPEFPQQHLACKTCHKTAAVQRLCFRSRHGRHGTRRQRRSLEA